MSGDVHVRICEHLGGRFPGVTRLTVANGTLSVLTSTDNITWTGTFTPTVNIEDTSNVVSLANTYTDVAGNAGTTASSANYTVETKAPTATIVLSDSALTVGETATVTITFSEAVSGFGLVDLSSDNGILSGLSAATVNGDGSVTYTATFTPTVNIEDTSNVVSLANSYTDVAGNAGTTASSANYTVETKAPTAPTVMSQTTNDTTPTISGTATVGAGETLTVVVNGATYSNVVVTGGVWSINTGSATVSSGVLGNFVDGETYSVTATVTDSAGNATNDATNGELVIDTTVPATPVVTSQTTNDLTPLITGTATLRSGESLTVEVNSKTYTAGDGHLSYNDSGHNWTLTIPSVDVLVEGRYSVMATVTDGAGNSTSDSTTGELIIDTTPPALPVVMSQTTNDTTPVISGRATIGSGETLTVVVNGATYSNVSVIGGVWSINTGNAAVSSGTLGSFVDGQTYSVMATVTDSAGNAMNDPTTGELVIDTTSPTMPMVTSQTTNDPTPVITGTAIVASNESLTVEVNSKTYTTGDGHLSYNDSAHTWTLTVPSVDVLAEGRYSVTAKVTDGAGNATSDSTNGELIIDTTAPATPVVTSQTTNDPVPVISGKATVGSGETLTVVVNGATYSNVTVTGGVWSVDTGSASVSSGTLGSFVDGQSYSVTATVTDSAGNATSDTTNGELVIDTTAPTAPTVVSQTTNDTTPVITGTATLGNGESLTIALNSQTYTAGDGHLSYNNIAHTWTLTIPPEDVLAEGIYSVTATVTDAAGNATSDSTSSELVIDTTAPKAPTVVSQTTNDTTPLITGTATVGSAETLSVVVNGATYSNVTVTGGVWSIDTGNAAVSSGTLRNFVDGQTYSVTATVTDSAGNATTDPTIGELVIDTTAPTAPTVVSQTTNDTTPVITGMATLGNGESLTIALNSQTYTAGDGHLSYNDTAHTWTLTIPPEDVLAEGIYSVTATVTDAAGNATSDSTGSELVIDTTAPAAPAVVSQTTNDTTPLITGTATVGSGETLTVVVNGATYSNVTVTGGVWSIDTGSALPGSGTLGIFADGQSYSVTATVTDSAGNATSDTTHGELVIDKTAPTAPTVKSWTTNDTTPVITGTATLGSGESLTVTVEVNGHSYTAGDGHLSYNDTAHTWTLTIPPEDVLAEGTYSVTATVMDGAGNATSDSTSSELVIDTTAPAAPTVVSQTTNDTTPLITGTATVGSGETLSVVVNGATYSNVTVTGGVWSIDTGSASVSSGTLGIFADGQSYSVTATVTDSAGNATNDTTNGELVIDRTAPTAPTVISQTTNDTTPVITGTATLGSNESLTVTVHGHSYTSGDGHLTLSGSNWSLTIPESDTLSGGTYSVTATVTDGAGNATSDSTNSELVINNISLNINDVTVNEGDGTVTFTVMRSGDSEGTTSVDYSTSDGTANAIADYTPTSGTLHFTAGETIKSITVAITDDHIFEGSEFFNVTLSNVNSGTTINDNFAVATIKDDDASTALPEQTSIMVKGKGDISEGSDAVFTVTLGAASSSATTITLAAGATGDSATYGVDYSTTFSAYYFAGSEKITLALTNGQISLPAGVTSFLVDVPTLNDTFYEGAERFTLNAAVTGGLSSSGIATILDDGTGQVYDEHGAVVSGSTANDDGYLRIPDVTVNEASSYSVFRVEASSNYSFTLSLRDGGVGYSGTHVATEGYDYTNFIQLYNGTTWIPYTTKTPVNVPTGGSVLLVRVPIINDAVYQADHTFTLVATPSGNRDVVTARGIIGDFGTGAIFNDSGAENVLAPKDDDRTIKVNSPIVNEGSVYSLFEVTGAPGIVSLALQVEPAGVGKANIPSGNGNIEFWDGTTWITYNASNAQILNTGELLVRVGITDEQDTVREVSETFGLRVMRGMEESLGVMAIHDDGTGVIYTFDGVNGAYSGTKTAGLDDDYDQDGITPTTEEALGTLAASQGIGNAKIGDLNGDGKQDDEQNALATLAWRHKADFEAGNNGTLTDSKAIISIGVVESFTASDSQISTTLQLLNIEVATYTEIDSTTRVVVNNDNTTTVTLVNGSEVTTPWDPIRFGVAGQDTNDDGKVEPMSADIDPLRNGTQVRVLIDVRASGMTSADANAYIKYVSAEAIKAMSLEDLDGLAITLPGWYDFTQRVPGGDGARLVVENGKIVEIELIITDNSFGDNDPVVGQIYDPGVLVKVTADLVTPRYTPDQIPGKVDFYGVTTGGVALNAWHNPITGDYFYAPAGTPLPYACYEPLSSDLGRVLEAGKGVFDVHLYLNHDGDTQIMGESAAAALGLVAKGYADMGAMFASANATALDSVAPSLTPNNGGTAVSLKDDVILSFSEDITKGSTGAIVLHRDSAAGEVVSATVSAAGKNLVINPVSDLDPHTHYFVTLDDGSVVDLAGNHYSGVSSYDFWTGDAVAADPYAVSVTSGGSTGELIGGVAALGLLAWLAL